MDNIKTETTSFCKVEPSAADLLRDVERDLQDARDRIANFDERAAIQEESRLQGKTIGEWALHWLTQPNTSWDRHGVARAWFVNMSHIYCVNMNHVYEFLNGGQDERPLYVHVARL